MATRPQTPSTPVAVYAVGNEHGHVVAGIRNKGVLL